MKIYLASLYSKRLELEEYARRLVANGHEITSSWVFGLEWGKTEQQNAEMDLADVDKAEAVISFTSPRGSYTRGGGRHIEFGYAYAKGKRCIIIGERENIFHFLPNVEQYDTLAGFIGDKNV